jgi:hypothetical protein
MEDSDQDVQEIDWPALNWIKRNKYRLRILIEPLDPYFYRHSKRNTVNHQIIDVEDDNIHAISDLSTDSTTQDVGIK